MNILFNECYMLNVKSPQFIIVTCLGLKICGINLNKGYGPTTTLIHRSNMVVITESVRHMSGWASTFTNVHSNILMYCRQHMHLFKSCHSGCLFIWLNCSLLVIRWAIKGPWVSSSELDPWQSLNQKNTFISSRSTGRHFFLLGWTQVNHH